MTENDVYEFREKHLRRGPIGYIESVCLHRLLAFTRKREQEQVADEAKWAYVRQLAREEAAKLLVIKLDERDRIMQAVMQAQLTDRFTTVMNFVRENIETRRRRKA